MDTSGLEPWDADAMTTALMEMVTTLPRERLDRIEAPPVPGAYLHFLDAAHLAPLLGEPAATGEWAAYVGVAATSVRSRLQRYRRALHGVGDLREDRVWVAVLPCSTAASAHFAETALLEHLTPVFEGLGWGSRPPGDGRPGKSPSGIDALLRGRTWAMPTTPLHEALARLRVLTALIRTDPEAPRWKALGPTTAPADASSPRRRATRPHP